jgi:hypothetical protein
MRRLTHKSLLTEPGVIIRQKQIGFKLVHVEGRAQRPAFDTYVI